VLCKKREGVTREKQRQGEGRESAAVRSPEKMTLRGDGNDEEHLAHWTQGPKLSNLLYPDSQDTVEGRFKLAF